MTDTPSPPRPPEELPMLAPCHDVAADAPLRWMQRGWADLRAAPRQSLLFGVMTVVLSYLVTAATWVYGNIGLYLGLVSGFVFVAPLLALTVYAISLQLERGRPPSLRRSLRSAVQSLRGAMFFAVILVIVLLVWARAANTLYIFFPDTADPALADLVLFLGIGSVVGALFSLVVFAASAFSLPMLVERRTDAITAVVTSVNAVLRNKRTMLVWALMIAACVAVAIVTAWLAFVVLMPLLGHATWHAYRETIDASEWPLLEQEA
ncbi:DUF2189 domain-containing protein [Alkalilimnicola ehrlichii MLHE-1]|uniref:Integral membrane protein n=1 Tax=Alkalilimnicola ehrlichii (strain ATCC BAA-1101 / DSM 17681 / MLHE-1) TaxID=187272 RepID=Q0A5Y4_ALKEH|nr:DUF2189 domain-containing protein [Alkalilimnicola ehrlichii]ABI57753.1 integral membrane protein [Alkalilimnicola ehrlichii MLHE-1]